MIVIGMVLSAPVEPVAADPARPTNFLSKIREASPRLPTGVAVRVIGGDAFLELTVEGDHTVTVRDYGTTGSRRPYLRFGPNGTVERNENSSAALVNESRYGSSGPQPELRSTAEPRWTVVATDGRYAWHDHRIHWMLPDTQPVTDAQGRVDLGGPDGGWSVPLVVDGREVSVRGDLFVLPPPTPVPWYALALVIAMSLVGWVAWSARNGRRLPYRAVAILVAIGGLAATGAGIVEWASIPSGAGGSPLTAALPLVGVISAIAAAAVPERLVRTRLVAMAASVAVLGAWALLRLPVLSHAVLPTELSAGLDRAATALALGVSVGLAAVLIWRPPGSETDVRRTP